ncbi:hypothetical protein VULLAG_LOCUS19926 [Vulpes lagopus]
MVISGVPGSLPRWAAARTLHTRIPERRSPLEGEKGCSETSASERARPGNECIRGGGGAPRGGFGSPDSGSPLRTRMRERSYCRAGNGQEPPSQVREETPRLPVAASANGRCSPHTPPGVASRAEPANASTSNRSSSRGKLAMRLRRGAGVGVGANAKQRRRQQQPEFLPPPPPPPPPPPSIPPPLPTSSSSSFSTSSSTTSSSSSLPPPPPPGEAAERLQLHLQQQPASPPPGAPLDLGREQPRQQLETKINSPPKAPRPAGGGAAGAPVPPRRAAPRRAAPRRSSPPGRSPRACFAQSDQMCACVRVCVYERVCFRHSPRLPPPTGGSRRPSVSPALPRPKAARPRARAERGDSRSPEPCFPRRAGRLRGHCGSAPPAHAPQRPQRRKFGFGGSPRARLSGGRGLRGAAPGGSALEGPLAASIPPPASQSSRAEGKSLGKATQGPSEGGRLGALTSARLMPAARGPTRGSGPRRLSARLRAPGARAAGHAVGAGGAERARRCGSGPPPPPLLLPPVSARGGLSRRSRSSPHATD